MVGGDVVDRVGCYGTGVDLHRTRFYSVHVCCDPEVEVGCGRGDDSAGVVVGVRYLDDGGVVAVDLDSAHDALCGTFAGAVQIILGGLITLPHKRPVRKRYAG